MSPNRITVYAIFRMHHHTRHTHTTYTMLPKKITRTHTNNRPPNQIKWGKLNSIEITFGKYFSPHSIKF